MYKPDGLSKFVFPALPILGTISILLLLLVLPGFIKTRSIPLLSYIVVMIYTNLLCIVNPIVWKHSTENKAPIYCRITTAISLQTTIAIPAINFCICRLVWLMSRRSPVVLLHDQRKKNRIIEIGLCIVFPLVTAVVVPFSITRAYGIVEDVGCASMLSRTFLPFIFYRVFPFAISCLGGVYCILAIYNFWRFKNDNSNLPTDATLPNTKRLTLLAVSNIVIIIPLFSFLLSQALPIDTNYWSWKDRKPHLDLSEVPFAPRFALDAHMVSSVIILLGLYCSILTAFQFFLFFGFGTAAMKNYRSVGRSIAASYMFKTIERCVNELHSWLVSLRPVPETIRVSPFQSEESSLEKGTISNHPPVTINIPRSKEATPIPVIVGSRKERLPAVLNLARQSEQT